MTERSIPKSVHMRLTDEGRGAISMLMEMGEVKKITDLYDLAITLLKNSALAVLEGKELGYYNKHDNTLVVIKSEFLDNISRNKGVISQEGVRVLLRKLDTDFLDQSQDWGKVAETIEEIKKANAYKEHGGRT